ncbi:uncharacterized protein LOC131235142 [Magnolia sinica]|uniref:uncharacterized protein LOC131235142 n=1 Tax=Magnolia sinica TaxID=86752 RepID=UPI002658DEF3|nr:uncharacterized protein LOC131235142 [Magnolia sinica]
MCHFPGNFKEEKRESLSLKEEIINRGWRAEAYSFNPLLEKKEEIMNTKGCMLLCILLLSILLIPSKISASRMLYNSHVDQLEASHQVDAVTVTPLDPNKTPNGGGRGRPYTLPCTKVYGCRGAPGP